MAEESVDREEVAARLQDILLRGNSGGVPPHKRANILNHLERLITGSLESGHLVAAPHGVGASQRPLDDVQHVVRGDRLPRSLRGADRLGRCVPVRQDPAIAQSR